MVFEKGESSRAGEEAAARHQRPWVALSSIIVVYTEDDEQSEALVPGAADLVLEHQDPPLLSYLALPERLVPDPRRVATENDLPYIITAAPGRLLFMATDLARGRNGVNSNYFLCDVRAGTAKRLPAVPADLPIKLSPSRNIGIVADPSSPGDHMIAQLHAAAGSSMRRHNALLCFSTATDQWLIKELANPPSHAPWGAHGVFPHDGFLWWVDVVYGMLFCNPFDDQPRLRLVPLPNGCAMPGFANRVYFSQFLDKRRCVRLSEGKLRYIQITGFSYNLATINDPPDNPTVSMWTLKALADQQNAADPWTWEYEVPFDHIWHDHKYLAAGLPRGKVPNLALVDPNNHYVIYFFQEKTLFAWDADAAELVSCAECLVDRDFLDIELQYSRFVEAWDPASPDDSVHEDAGGNGTTGLHDEEQFELISLREEFLEAAAHGSERPCVHCFRLLQEERREKSQQKRGSKIGVQRVKKDSFFDHSISCHRHFMEKYKATRIQCQVCGNWLASSTEYNRHMADLGKKH